MTLAVAIVVALATVIVAITVAALLFVHAHEKRLHGPSERDRMLEDARSLERRASSDITLMSSDRKALLDQATKIRQQLRAVPEEHTDA